MQVWMNLKVKLLNNEFLAFVYITVLLLVWVKSSLIMSYKFSASASAGILSLYPITSAGRCPGPDRRGQFGPDEQLVGEPLFDHLIVTIT